MSFVIFETSMSLDGFMTGATLTIDGGRLSGGAERVALLTDSVDPAERKDLNA